MNPILVNVDYENVLFGGHPLVERIKALEFIAFWVQRNPVHIHRTYSELYLDHVKKYTGHLPSTVAQGPSEPWWGELKNTELEKKLNSKIWARQWWQSRYSFEDKICYSESEVLDLIQNNQWWLIKRNFGMSGKGNRRVKLDEWEKNKNIFQTWYPEGVIVEPLRKRVSDVSALWLPEEQKFIYYRNEIDNHFQWRGVILENGGAPQFSDEELTLLDPWYEALKILAKDIKNEGYGGPFSVDAFFYTENEKLNFHLCSEINGRKTMGWVAKELWKLNQPPFSSLFLDNKKTSLNEWKTKVDKLERGSILLSPEDSLFTWYWVEASTKNEFDSKIQKIKNQ